MGSLSQHEQRQSQPQKFDIVQLFTIYGVDVQGLVNKWKSSREGGNADLKLEDVAASPELLCYIDKESASVERIDDLKEHAVAHSDASSRS